MRRDQDPGVPGRRSTVVMRSKPLADGRTDNQIQAHGPVRRAPPRPPRCVRRRHVLVPAPATDRHRCWCVRSCGAPTRDRRSHLSSAVERGAPVWGLSLDQVHTTRTDRRNGRREAGIVHHRVPSTRARSRSSTASRSPRRPAVPWRWRRSVVLNPPWSRSTDCWAAAADDGRVRWRVPGWSLAQHALRHDRAAAVRSPGPVAGRVEGGVPLLGPGAAGPRTTGARPRRARLSVRLCRLRLAALRGVPGDRRSTEVRALPSGGRDPGAVPDA